MGILTVVGQPATAAWGVIALWQIGDGGSWDGGILSPGINPGVINMVAMRGINFGLTSVYFHLPEGYTIGLIYFTPTGLGQVKILRLR